MSLRNTKRLGRFAPISSNNNYDSQSYFDQLASSYIGSNLRLSSEWDKPVFSRRKRSLEAVLAHAKKRIEESQKFLNKIKLREMVCVNRSKAIPKNATIRKEYIKCGKEMCEQKHGPYYYAYWKDPESRKLKKKYIGDHMPKDK